MADKKTSEEQELLAQDIDPENHIARVSNETPGSGTNRKIKYKTLKEFFAQLPKFSLEDSDDSQEIRLSYKGSDGVVRYLVISNGLTGLSHNNDEGTGVYFHEGLVELFNVGKGIIIDTDGDVAIGASDVEPCAILELKSTSKGVLHPRMRTAQVDAIVNPVPGLEVFDVDVDKKKIFTATNGWEIIQSI